MSSRFRTSGGVHLVFILHFGDIQETDAITNLTESFNLTGLSNDNFTFVNISIYKGKIMYALFTESFNFTGLSNDNFTFVNISLYKVK